MSRGRTRGETSPRTGRDPFSERNETSGRGKLTTAPPPVGGGGTLSYRSNLFELLSSLTHRDRFLSDGGKDLGEVLRRWKPWLPPKQSQAVLQGGAICFDGRETVFLHRDPATGAHADFEAALEALGA